MSEETIVAEEGITVTKGFDRDGFPVPAVTFRVESDRSEPTDVRIVDEIPSAFGIEQIGFHPEYGSDHWTATGEGVVRFERTVDAGESFTTVYGVKMSEDQPETPFLGAPSLDVDPDGGEGTAVDDVIPQESSDVVRELADGRRDSIPGLDDEPDESQHATDEPEPADDTAASAVAGDDAEIIGESDTTVDTAPDEPSESTTDTTQTDEVIEAGADSATSADTEPTEDEPAFDDEILEGTDEALTEQEGAIAEPEPDETIEASEPGEDIVDSSQEMTPSASATEPVENEESVPEDEPTIADDAAIVDGQMDDGQEGAEEMTVDDEMTISDEPSVDDGTTVSDEPSVDDGTTVDDGPSVDDGTTVDDEPSVDDDTTAGDEVTVDGERAVDHPTEGDDEPMVERSNEGRPVDATTTTDSAMTDDTTQSTTTEPDPTTETDEQPSGADTAGVTEEPEGLAARLAAEIRAGTADDEDLAVIRDAVGQPTGTDEIRLEHLQARVSDLEAYTDALEEFLDENGRARTILDDVETTVEDIAADVEDVESRVDSATGEREALRERVNTLADDLGAVDDVAESIDRLTGDLEALEERVADGEEARMEVAALEDDLSDVEDTLDDIATDVEEFKEWRSQLSDLFN